MGVGIIGTGSFVPDKILTNFDLEKIVDTSDEWIRTRTGIRERRILEEDKATSYMATEAAKRAIENAGINAEDIDLIMVATVTPDMAFPSTACIVQDNLDCKNAAAFDLEAGCSGFLYGLSLAYSQVKAGLSNNVLLIGAETLSRIINWKDRSTCVLFGDGAGAAVISRVPNEKGILAIDLGADGSGKEYLTQPAGGSKMPATKESIDNELHYINMEGNEVFKFAVRTMKKASVKVIQKSGLDIEDIDFLIPHQANIRIIEAARKRLKLDEDRVYVNLDKYGNMSAASIPVALDEANRKNKIKDGDNIVLVGFGAGLTWGSCVIKWHK
ncbi:3-oxoacyl-ACP synthase [Thermohalobacter berrensis]|uniref:Beta-ketoacyl-[acyl-carrier-protein] synthase III n=2 Tax=Thermohalobacter berrensis TaxID=99594 RepID=A0A419TB96_9FIRM|nr:3-oxoacyl-ACP synthase [Thermohalobacter berrensis]